MSQPNIEKEAGPPAQADTPVEETPVNEKRKREYKDFGHDEVKATRTFYRSLALLTRLFSGLTAVSKMPMLTCQGYDSLLKHRIPASSDSQFFPHRSSSRLMTCMIRKRSTSRRLLSRMFLHSSNVTTRVLLPRRPVVVWRFLVPTSLSRRNRTLFFRSVFEVNAYFRFGDD